MLLLTKFPIKFCGIWALITSSNNILSPGSKVRIDYNNVQLATDFDLTYI